jgi:protein gp37
MAKTKIEWTDEVFNPVTGCTKISEGCTHCYAETMCRRFWKQWDREPPPDHFKVKLHPDRLGQPLRWKKPRRIFVCSMGDLFHEDVSDGFLDRVWQTMRKAKQHTFLVLTKRPERMRHAIDWLDYVPDGSLTLPNVHLGVTVENQEAADERIPLLLQTPAAVRFVSCEPLLSEIDLSEYLHCGIGWCIIGAESGPNRRPMKEEWVRELIAQCKQIDVPVFYKQAYQNGKKVSLPMIDGRQYVEYPQTTGKPNAS